MTRGKVRIEAEKSALLLIDFQPDFMPGGALPVREGDAIVRPTAELIQSGIFRLVLASQDWHPPNHISFASNHPGKKPYESISLYNHPQTLWPDHCVQGSKGARVHAGIPLNSVAAIVRKGLDYDCDSYSAFRNNWNRRGERPATGLAGYLRERGVRDLYICGLARDCCVKWSAEDAVDAAFRVWILWDLTRPLDASSDKMLRREFAERGIRIIDSQQLTP